MCAVAVGARQGCALHFFEGLEGGPSCFGRERSVPWPRMTMSLNSGPAVEWVPLTAPGGHGPRVAVDALQDGDRLLAPAPLGARLEVRRAMLESRAEGTAAFARRLALELGQPGVLIGRVARSTLDFDRPPGVDLHGRSRALGQPLAGLLAPEGRRSLIEETYRQALVELAKLRCSASLAISVLGRDRPESKVRILGSADPSRGRAKYGELVPGAVFERIAHPDVLGAVKDAFSGFDREVGPDPAGPLDPESLAVRGAVFDWTKYLQECLERDRPGRGEDLGLAGRRLWSALLDTSGLYADTWAVRAYLYHGLESWPAEAAAFRDIQTRYDQIRRWFETERERLVRAFFAPECRRNHLVIELPWGWSGPAIEEAASRVAEALHPFIDGMMGRKSR